MGPDDSARRDVEQGAPLAGSAPGDDPNAPVDRRFAGLIAVPLSLVLLLLLAMGVVVCAGGVHAAWRQGFHGLLGVMLGGPFAFAGVWGLSVMWRLAFARGPDRQAGTLLGSTAWRVVGVVLLVASAAMVVLMATGRVALSDVEVDEFDPDGRTPVSALAATLMCAAMGSFALRQAPKTAAIERALAEAGVVPRRWPRRLGLAVVAAYSVVAVGSALRGERWKIERVLPSDPLPVAAEADPATLGVHEVVDELGRAPRPSARFDALVARALELGDEARRALRLELTLDRPGTVLAFGHVLAGAPEIAERDLRVIASRLDGDRPEVVSEALAALVATRSPRVIEAVLTRFDPAAPGVVEGVARLTSASISTSEEAARWLVENRAALPPQVLPLSAWTAEQLLEAIRALPSAGLVESTGAVVSALLAAAPAEALGQLVALVRSADATPEQRACRVRLLGELLFRLRRQSVEAGASSSGDDDALLAIVEALLRGDRDPADPDRLVHAAATEALASLDDRRTVAALVLTFDRAVRPFFGRPPPLHEVAARELDDRDAALRWWADAAASFPPQLLPDGVEVPGGR